MKIVVTGGRNFNDIDLVWSTLDKVFLEHRFHGLITGMAKGADSLSWSWAKDRGVKTTECPITKQDRRLYGLGAGPMRNQRMVDLKPALCVAFPGGNGTADMVRRCKIAQIVVYEAIVHEYQIELDL